MLRIAVVSNSARASGNVIWSQAATSSDLVGIFLPFKSRDLDPSLANEANVQRTSALQPPGMSESFRIDIGLVPNLRRFGPDLIHFVGEPWGLGLAQCLTVGVPTVIHGAETRYQQGNAAFDRLRSIGARRNLRRVSGAVGWNRDALDAMRAHGLSLATPTAILPATTRGRRMAPKVATARQAREPLRAVFVGRLVPEKGVDTLLHAADGCQAALSVSIVGDGPMREELERLSSTTSNPAAFFGARPLDEVRELIRNHDVLVLPSRDVGYVCEQFGLVLVEAMAEGTAIVASDACSIPEVIDGYAILVPPDDVSALRNALIKLATDDGELRRLSSLSAARYDSYSPENLAHIARDLWARALRNRDLIT